MEKNIPSKYQVTWVEFRAKNGIVTKHDEGYLLGCTPKGRNGSRIFKHFRCKEDAVDCINELKSSGWYEHLEKHYEVRFCSDAQFGLSEVTFKNGRSEILVKYTKKQEEEMFTI